MSQRQSLERIFEAQVQTLSLTLQPFTVAKYQYVARHFVGYLRATFPEVRRLSQLRRDPHMLGWFRWLCELRPPVGNHTREQRLLCLRRLFDDMAAQGHPLQPGLRGAGTIKWTNVRQEVSRHEIRECSSSPDEFYAGGCEVIPFGTVSL